MQPPGLRSQQYSTRWLVQERVAIGVPVHDGQPLPTALQHSSAFRCDQANRQLPNPSLQL